MATKTKLICYVNIQPNFYRAISAAKNAAVVSLIALQPRLAIDLERQAA